MDERTFLENTPLFSSLEENEITAVRKMGTFETFEPNEVLFREGDSGNALYMIGISLFCIWTLLLSSWGTPLVSGEQNSVDSSQPGVRMVRFSEHHPLCRIEVLKKRNPERFSH